MTANRRIFWNVVVSYGQSLFAMACGLFTGRWALMALGETNYGLFGCVGGLTLFVSFFNTLLAWSIGRFYAYAVGECASNRDLGKLHCKEWFNTAVLVHVVLSVSGIAIGYPIGAWAIKNFLTIAPERVHMCVIIFRIVCFSCFVSMINVPFYAMYRAKQFIAEISIYSTVVVGCNFVFMWYIVNHPGDWLLSYSAWMCLMSVIPQIIICVRAAMCFQECRFSYRMLWNKDRLQRLLSYAGWQVFSTLGIMLQGQGLQLVYNKLFGANVNAAATVSSSVNGHANALSASMQGAFSPAITNACGEGDRDKMRRMVFTSCKYGSLFTLIFVIPLSLELGYILKLWLKNPPQYTAGLCIYVFIATLLDKLTSGHNIAICAVGKVRDFQLFSGLSYIMTIPMALGLVCLHHSPYSVAMALVVSGMLVTIVRVYYAHKFARISIWQWLSMIVIPILKVAICAICCGLLVINFCETSFCRVIITVVITEAVMVGLSWLIVLNDAERDLILKKIKVK